MTYAQQSCSLTQLIMCLAGPDCQHVVIDEFLRMVSGCVLETDACHWMFKTKVNMVQGQEDAPLKGNFGLGLEDCQQAVIDECLCILFGCVLGTVVCHWMFKAKSTA